MKHEALKALIDDLGKKYSEILGINLVDAKDEEIFKWFLASVLFGAPIRENSVVKTYRCFERGNVLTPQRILETGWDGLVKILDEGGYTRYDFKTADKLLNVMRNLIEKYGGSLKSLHERASECENLERMLKDLGKGIGDVTTNVFLRELRGIWKKANPDPASPVVLAAKNLGIIQNGTNQATLKELEDFWRRNALPGKSFINFETALLRLGKRVCKKEEKCVACAVKDGCSYRMGP